jgi:hypothetical protein
LDALERRKAIVHPDKRVGMRALIDRAASSPELADELDSQAQSLSKIGNEFRIRPHETTKQARAIRDLGLPVPPMLRALVHVLDLNPAP